MVVLDLDGLALGLWRSHMGFHFAYFLPGMVWRLYAIFTWCSTLAFSRRVLGASCCRWMTQSLMTRIDAGKSPIPHIPGIPENLTSEVDAILMAAQKGAQISEAEGPPG